MDKEQKQALQVAKEIVVKFIEVGRVTPANFSEIFPKVYQEILRAVDEAQRSSATSSGLQTSEKSEKKSS